MDGYNLPLAIEAILFGAADHTTLLNRSNPACIGSVDYLQPTTWNPYAGGAEYLNTSAFEPLPLEDTITPSDVSNWCPTDLQMNAKLDTPAGPPSFNPCMSACSMYNEPIYCCSGDYSTPQTCKPNYYAKAAKAVCPDAYSYAYDDDSATFTVPTGSGFEVVFCPLGRSTTIRRTLAGAAPSLTIGIGKLLAVVAFTAMLNLIR